MSFSLHPQLEADTFLVKDLPICRVLLMDNALFPWLILVPRRAGLVELFDVPDDERMAMMEEVSYSAEKLKQHFAADKVNIASLGNQVPQLHIHVVARFKDDSAWPQPVWGKGSEKYTEAQHQTLLETLRAML
jgi:diadenosine tetraphosphate (Ap4A) HIT family hydrolase